MLTLEIKINGELIGKRIAYQVDGPDMEGEHKYYVLSPSDSKCATVHHKRTDGATVLVRKMIRTMQDDGTESNIQWGTGGQWS